MNDNLPELTTLPAGSAVTPLGERDVYMMTYEEAVASLLTPEHRANCNICRW